MSTPEARLLTMFLGWIAALYGVHRRDWPGTMIAMSGLVLADAAMIIRLQSIPHKRRYRTSDRH